MAWGWQEEAPVCETARASLSTASGFLLASDGLWDNVYDAELEAVFEVEYLDKAVRSLVTRAKIRGAPWCDNIAVAAIRRCGASESDMEAGQRHRGESPQCLQGSFVLLMFQLGISANGAHWYPDNCCNRLHKWNNQMYNREATECRQFRFRGHREAGRSSSWEEGPCG